MGQAFWAMLEQYAGCWVAIDKGGQVVDHAETFEELSRRAAGLTIVYAATER